MITAHLASTPDRIDILPVALKSIAPYVDHVYVALNNYPSIPKLDIPNITFKMCDNSRGDAHKFEFIHEVSGFALITDDDLIWNEFAINFLRKKVERYACPCSYHGKSYPVPFTGFKHMSGNYRCLGNTIGDHVCQIIGTGTLMLNTSMLKLSMADFPYPNMADVLFSRVCAIQSVKLMAVEHSAGIIGYLNPQKTIWNSTRSYALHDSIIRSFLK